MTAASLLIGGEVSSEERCVRIIQGSFLKKFGKLLWRKLKGAARLAEVIDGVHFKDGLQKEAQRIGA